MTISRERARPGSTRPKKPLRGPACPREFVIQRIIQREQLSETGGQPLLHFRPEQRLLVLLLGLVPAAVERVQRGPRRPLCDWRARRATGGRSSR